MIIAIHAIVVALALAAVPMIDKITGIAIASLTLVIAKARTTMPNTETVPDQDPGPVLVILIPQDTIMVTTFTMMTNGVGSGHTLLLPTLVQNGINKHPLLKPNLQQLYIKNLLLI